MKKLIALIAAIAVMMSMTVVSFAADEEATALPEIKLNADGKTYTAALPEAAATANDGKQTTIVAYTGDTIAVGSIQYINQDAVDEFTFQLKDALTADVKVVMGGENILKQDIGIIKYVAPVTTVAVSGTISTTSANKAGKVYLYAGNDTSVAAAYTADITAGAYNFAAVEPGEYTLVIDKPAHIAYSSALTVAKEAKVIADIAMITGDTTGDKMINASDFTPVAANAGQTVAVDGEAFAYTADTTGDEMINASDFTPVAANAGAVQADYPAIQ